MKAMIRTIALGVGLSLCLPLAALAEPEQGKPLTLESLLQSRWKRIARRFPARKTFRLSRFV